MTYNETAEHRGESINIPEAARHIELLTGSRDTVVKFQTFDDDADRKRPALAQTFDGTIAEHAEALRKLNDRGDGVFIEVNEGEKGKRSAERVTRIRAVFVDLDDPTANPLAAIESSRVDPDFVVESSAGKFHTYRRIDGFPVDRGLFAGAQRALAAKAGGDPVVNDLPRVMRLAGFQHRKVRDGIAAEPFVTRVHEARHENRVTGFEALLAEFGWSVAALMPGDAKAASKSVKVQPVGSRVAGDPFVAQISDGHGRNAHAVELAGMCAGLGLDTDTTISRVLAWNAQNCEPIDESVIADICKRIVAKEHAKRASGSAGGGSMVFTELGFAQWFATQNAHHLRFVADLGKWIAWDGRTWTFDDAPVMNAAKDLARSILTSAAREPDDAKRDALRRYNAKMETAKALKNALSLAQTEAVLATASCDLDRDPMLISVDNGVIDLRTGGWRAARTDDLMTKRAHVSFHHDATCPRWLTFIEEVTCGDKELAGYLQRMAGYCLTGSTREQALLLLVGSGANGKSVYTKTLQSMLGSYSVRLPASALAARRNDSVPADIAMLAGARVALASELNAGMQLDEARVKDLVSDDTITARHLYGSFFSFSPTHKLIVASNHLPIVAGTDHGIWRRIRVARFEARFDESKRDVHLLDKLMAEASGILNWMIDGCRQWQEQGLATPPSIEVWAAEYRGSLDVVGQFIDQCCTTAAADPENASAYKVGAAVLVDAYQQFAVANGLPKISGRTLANELKQRGFQTYKSHGTSVYRGLAVYRPWVSDWLREKIAESGSLQKAGIWEPVVGAFVVDPTDG